jgi:hypothetical protein
MAENNVIWFFAQGLAANCSALLIWFYSPLKITLGQLFIDKNLYSIDQVDTAVLILNKWIGKLISCYICMSFWVSLLIGLLYLLFFDAPAWFPMLTATSYPSLCYIFKKIIDKN